MHASKLSCRAGASERLARLALLALSALTWLAVCSNGVMAPHHGLSLSQLATSVRGVALGKSGKSGYPIPS